MTTNDNTSARAGLDLDAVEARARDNEDFRTYHLAQDSADDVPALLAEVRRLRGLLDAETAAHRGDLRDDAKALDDLVAQVWTAATGSVHEGPASVDALLNTVLDMRNSRDALRYEVSTALHLPPTIGPAPGELARVMRATEEARDKSLAGLCPQGYVVIPLALHDAACRLASDVERLQREVDAARREGAEAMREACYREAREWSAAATDVGGEVDGRLARTIANHIRALPLPGGEL